MVYLSNPLKTLAENIAAGIARTGLNQSSLAQRAGVSPTYLSQLLAEDNGNPSLERLSAIGKEIGLEVWELFRPAGTDLDHPLAECARRVFEDIKTRSDGSVASSLAVLADDLQKGGKEAQTGVRGPKNRKR